MEDDKLFSTITLDSPLICRVCGDVARGMNFEVITCMSCKAFFRRNALRTSKELLCQFTDACPITQRTRGGCSACRLKKCLALGMNARLIRSSPKKHTASSVTKTLEHRRASQLQPTTLCLVNKDRPTLNLNEWNLLSNLIQAYDEENLITRTQSSLREQTSLPPKIRSKKCNTLELIGSFYTAIQSFLERSPFYQNLSRDTRQILVQNNLHGTGGLNCLYVAKQAKVFENDIYTNVCNEIYGEEYVRETRRLIERLDSNGTLVKLMFTILLFASNSSIILSEHRHHLPRTSPANSITLTQIQDVFIHILWKYLIYQYGHTEAVRRLNYLVKIYLDLLHRISENSSTEHMQMIEHIIGQTSNSSTLKN